MLNDLVSALGWRVHSPGQELVALSSMEPCIDKDYGEIWRIYSAKHGDTRETREIHLKWKRLAAEVWRYGR